MNLIGVHISHDDTISGLWDNPTYSWTKYPSNPILRYGSPRAWDEYGLLAPRLWCSKGIYHMNYRGKPNNTTKLSSIGHATATSLAV